MQAVTGLPFRGMGNRHGCPEQGGNRIILYQYIWQGLLCLPPHPAGHLAVRQERPALAADGDILLLATAPPCRAASRSAPTGLLLQAWAMTRAICSSVTLG